jgi:hypothetical protein
MTDSNKEVSASELLSFRATTGRAQRVISLDYHVTDVAWGDATQPLVLEASWLV